MEINIPYACGRSSQFGSRFGNTFLLLINAQGQIEHAWVGQLAAAQESEVVAKWMVLVDGEGVPLGVRLESASPREVKFAEATLKPGQGATSQRPASTKPERVIAGTAYDSDPLRKLCRHEALT